METITDRIRPHVDAIKSASDAGCVYARNVITLHNLLVRRAEPGAYGLCEAAFNEWLEFNTK